MIMTTKRDYLYKIDFDYLIRFASETKIYRNYRKYFTKKDFVHALLRNLTKKECVKLYNASIDNIPPEKIAQEYMSLNPTYEIIRDRLVKFFINEQSENDEVIFFEFPVLNARTDVTRINGNSFNYEIKTGRDKITRLEKQMSTFIRLFEQNIVVCSVEFYEDVLEYIPDIGGVILYEILEKGISFREEISSKRSFFINSRDQLRIVTVKGLKKIHEKKIGKPNRLKRGELTKKILSQLTDDEINEEFKLYLKEKYSCKKEISITNF